MKTEWSPQVARVMHEVADAAPMAPSADALATHRPPNESRSRVAVAGGAFVLVVALVAGLFAIAGRDAGSPAGDSVIEVHHAQYATTIDANIECTQPIDDPGRFSKSTIDLWADREGRQWRNTVSYPNGATYDIVRRGSSIYPTEMASRGTALDVRVACRVGSDTYRFVTPFTDGIVSLTIAAEIAPDERPFVRLPTDVGTLVDPTAVDSQGRTTELWEQRIEGTWTGNAGPSRQLTQVRRWWIDPTDGTVTQQQFTDNPEGLGTVTSTITMTLSETIRVAASQFATDGWNQMETGKRPDLPPITATSTRSECDLVNGAMSMTDENRQVLVDYLLEVAPATLTPEVLARCEGATQTELDRIQTLVEQRRSAISTP